MRQLSLVLALVLVLVVPACRDKGGEVPAAPIAAALVPQAPAPPPVPEAPIGTFHAIILAGGATDAEAKATQALLMAKPMRALTVAEGLPAIFDSGALPGLKPGFQILVLGFCEDAAAAKELSELMRLEVPGAYSRAVEGRFQGQCPRVSDLRAVLQAGFTVAGDRPLLGKTGDPRWQIATGPDDSVVLSVDLGGKRLFERFFLGTQSSEEFPRDEGDVPPGTHSSESVEWRGRLVTVGERSLAIIEGDEFRHSAGAGVGCPEQKRSTELFGYGCGQFGALFSKIEELPERGRRCDFGEERPFVHGLKEVDGWRMLAALDEAGEESLRLRWSDEQCRYEEAPALAVPGADAAE